MKLAKLKIFANELDPTEKVVMVQGVKPGQMSAKIYQSAAPAANAYALASVSDWWARTVNARWRSAINPATGGPVRYEKYQAYQFKVATRVLKLLRAKGVK